MGERARGNERGETARARPLRLAAWRRSPGWAAVLAILIPGAGHLYAGRSGAAAAWLVAILLGYWAVFLPGAMLHAISIWSAHRAADAQDPAPDVRASA